MAGANAEIALRYLDLAITQRDPAEAARQYLGETYIQHNPSLPPGVEGFLAGIGGLLEQFPDFSMEVRRVIAEGDLVAIHGLAHWVAGDRGSAVADIFRIEDGRIVEHWDVVQAVPETAANANGMV